MGNILVKKKSSDRRWASNTGCNSSPSRLILLKPVCPERQLPARPKKRLGTHRHFGHREYVGGQNGLGTTDLSKSFQIFRIKGLSNHRRPLYFDQILSSKLLLSLLMCLRFRRITMGISLDHLLWLWMNIWAGVQFAIVYNQNSGYRRFLGMLFTNSATTSMKTGPTPPGMSTYKYPRLWIF